MLKNKVAVITGGTRGIGYQTAKTFLKNGAKVFIFGTRKETVEKALDQLKRRFQTQMPRECIPILQILTRCRKQSEK